MESRKGERIPGQTDERGGKEKGSKIRMTKHKENQGKMTQDEVKARQRREMSKGNETLGMNG